MILAAALNPTISRFRLNVQHLWHAFQAKIARKALNKYKKIHVSNCDKSGSRDYHICLLLKPPSETFNPRHMSCRKGRE